MSGNSPLLGRNRPVCSGEAGVIRASDSRWYACYTRARHERTVCEWLAGRAITTFLPMVPRRRRWKDRQKIVMWPLFPSYVFVQFPLRELGAVLSAPGISAVVRSEGVPAPISEDELDNVRFAIAAVTAAGVEPEVVVDVESGQLVRIEDGPLRGVKGIVVTRRGTRRVLISVTGIGCAVEVDIDAIVRHSPGDSSATLQ